MKTQELKQQIRRIARSITVLIIYILFIAGSCDVDLLLDLGLKGKKPVGEDTYEGTVTDGYFIATTTGKLDGRNRWHGPVTITASHRDSMHNVLTESVEMVHGKRNGTGYYKGKNRWGQEVDETKCWIMDQRDMDCDGVIQKDGKKAADQSAFQILKEKYYWYLFSLYASGYDDEYVQAFLDTVEAELAIYEFEESEFYVYYDTVMENLRETPYDSIIVTNENKTVHNAHAESLNSEFRLAVFDRYTTDSDNLFNIFQTKYPGYLNYLNKNEVSNEDFETYCVDFENIMAGYDPISQDDPLFLDSLDWRMCMTVIALGEEEEEKAMASRLISGKNIMRELKYHNLDFSSKSTNSDITTLIIIKLFNCVYEGEIMSKSVKEAWLINQGIATFPTVVTTYTETNTIEGYVLEDGGAEVTKRGIAWAIIYNPTLNNNTETLGSGTGKFSITLEGLTEGITYYARSFAINSVDTAYGNCVEFVAGYTSGLAENELFAETVTLYPNPANNTTFLKLRLRSTNEVILTIMNIKGQKVYVKNFGELTREEQEITVDISGLAEGTYICNLSTGERLVSKKIAIVR